MDLMLMMSGLIVFVLITWRGRAAGLSPAVPRLWNLKRFGITQPAPGVSTPALSTSSERFAVAVRKNSNLELDWLWLATQVTRDAERRYCLERALYINPRSDAARQALAKLPQQAAEAADVPAFARRGGA